MVVNNNLSPKYHSPLGQEPVDGGNPSWKSLRPIAQSFEDLCSPQLNWVARPHRCRGLQPSWPAGLELQQIGNSDRGFWRPRQPRQTGAHWKRTGLHWQTGLGLPATGEGGGGGSALPPVQLRQQLCEGLDAAEEGQGGQLQLPGCGKLLSVCLTGCLTIVPNKLSMSRGMLLQGWQAFTFFTPATHPPPSSSPTVTQFPHWSVNLNCCSPLRAVSCNAAALAWSCPPPRCLSSPPSSTSPTTPSPWPTTPPWTNLLSDSSSCECPSTFNTNTMLLHLQRYWWYRSS